MLSIIAFIIMHICAANLQKKIDKIPPATMPYLNDPCCLTLHNGIMQAHEYGTK